MPTIDWPNSIINIARTELQLVQSTPTEIRQLNLDNFRLDLKSLEDDPEGMPWPKTHNHNPPVSVGGVTLARVVEILAPYTITFEDGQYAVNLVGANSNVGDRVNVNQVSIRSANSAGLTYSKEVEDQSFEGARVWIDTINGQSGIQFPRGTPGDPVSNLADAQAIIAARNLPKRLFLRGTLSLTALDNVADYDILGSSVLLAAMDLGGANTTNLQIASVAITGTASGAFYATGASSFDNITNFAGMMYDCGLSGTIDFAPDGSGNEYSLINCHSDVAGPGSPIIDVDNITSALISVRKYTGSITITNMTDANARVSVDLIAGRVVIDPSCTAGTIVIGGTGSMVNNSNLTPVTNRFNQVDVRDQKLDELWKFRGLDPNNPLSITDTQQSSGGVTVGQTDNGTTTTVTRQP